MSDTIFTHDAATDSFSADVDGITVDEDGTATFDWSEVPVVQLDEPPHAEAFDTDEFYKIEGATVARPIKQPYRAADSIQWYKKPADELRRMAWSLDNAPFTLGHPETGMVKDVNDIHGFWKNPRYDDDGDRLKEDLYIPKNDAEATEFVSEHQDVSMGFYNRVYSEYDGDTGDLTDDDVDGFQVDMFGNHVAGVKQGRCSGEDGCGLDAEKGVGTVVLKTTEPDMETVTDDESNGACGCGGNTETEEDHTNMSDTDGDTDGDFDIPDLSIDALASRHEEVAGLREAKDEMESALDEMRDELGLDEDECPCDHVSDLVEAKDDAEGRVEDLEEELDGYREAEREEALDDLSEYLDEDALEAYEDSDLDELREEVDRLEALAEKANFDVKNVEESKDESPTRGSRKFGRGHGSE